MVRRTKLSSDNSGYPRLRGADPRYSVLRSGASEAEARRVDTTARRAALGEWLRFIASRDMQRRQCHGESVTTYFAVHCRTCRESLTCERDGVVCSAEISAFTAAHQGCADLELRIDLESPVDHGGNQPESS